MSSANRDGFSTRLGFILAVAGSAVGLGNIWGFPFRASEGGGAAFVLVYLLFCFVLCFPVMVAEITIGRRSGHTAVGAFGALGHPRWRWLGYLGIACGVLILAFYNIIAAWSFGYFIQMLLGNFDIGNQFDEFVQDWLSVGLYAFIFLAVTALVVSRGIAQGIERAAKWLMPSLLLMIVGLSVYGLTLPGADKGLAFYLVPDFTKLSWSVAYSALGQAFFSLSLGMCALVTFGSYLGKSQNIVSSAAMITLCDVGVALIAGLMIFPLVFSLGLEPNGGMGLIFKTLPPTFANLGPVLGHVIGTLFFLLLSFAAFTSTIALLEIPVAHLVVEHRWQRKKSHLAGGARDIPARHTFAAFPWCGRKPDQSRRPARHRHFKFHEIDSHHRGGRDVASGRLFGVCVCDLALARTGLCRGIEGRQPHASWPVGASLCAVRAQIHLSGATVGDVCAHCAANVWRLAFG